MVVRCYQRPLITASHEDRVQLLCRVGSHLDHEPGRLPDLPTIGPEGLLWVETITTPPVKEKAKRCLLALADIIIVCPLWGDIRKNWNDTEKISMAPAQG